MAQLERHPYSAQQLLQQLKTQGYAGGYSILKEFVRLVRPVRKPAFLMLEFAPGECAQVDWGSFGSSGRGFDPPAPELLCHGAVLQPHDVRGVHALGRNGAVPFLPSPRAGVLWRLAR